MRYQFLPMNACPMCGAPTERSAKLGLRLNRSTGIWPRSSTGVAVTVVNCDSCGLNYCDPMPIPLQLSQHYNVEPTSYWQDSYFKVSADYFGQEIRRAKELLGHPHKPVALDIGAGIGKCVVALQRAGFDAYGIEPSASFRECGLRTLGISEEQIQLASVETADFPAGYFDFITFGAVLEHLPEPQLALDKALGWLKRDGILFAEVPSSRWLISRIHNVFYRLQGTSFVTNLSPMHPPYHLYEFTPRSFSKYAETRPCLIAFSEHYICPIYHLPRFTHRALRWIMGKTNSGMQLAVWLRKT